MIKYVRYGNPRSGIPMFLITRYRTYHRSWKVEVLPCDMYGAPVSDAVAWDIFPTWWDTRKYMRQQYEEFYRYVNEKR
jgi:hypothetical protein